MCSRIRPACFSICISMSGTPGGIIIVGTSNMPRSVRVEVLNHLATMVYPWTPITVAPRDQIPSLNGDINVKTGGMASGDTLKCIRKHFKRRPEFVSACGDVLYVVRKILSLSGNILNAVRNLFSHAETAQERFRRRPEHSFAVRKQFKCRPKNCFARGDVLDVVRNLLSPSGNILNAFRNLFSHAETFKTSSGILFRRPEAF